MQNKSEYPENWNDEIRPRILIRDSYKCCHCGVLHRKSIVWLSSVSWKYINDSEVKEWKLAGYKAYKVFLQVAHIDNDKQNCEDINLKALCSKCHLTMDRRWKMLVRIGNLVKPSSSSGQT